ncbi:SDR family NAD(P)-dependent oxidoreductase [Algicella marina]|uniref:SDR family NAD(P)-dependent oxidoreductase n=1 Tax=Algicella marina TaxID=2683284 RepID=A0A6P1SXY4_9RHOB|nr:SDR family NAD(P)-dependent oxidoreductase [Algicella marina]QHQ35338.1 SDR family NAD(P)-dependent oxidoreductase [Algicella marina]
MKIAGCAAVVSGGASGLGAATARALAERGATVTVLDLNRDAGEAVADEIGGLFVATDVTDGTAVSAALAKAAEAHGVARIAVSCAGIAPGAKTVDREGKPHDPDVFAKVMAVNLMGTFNLATQAAAGMVALEPEGEDGERGVIVNTASIAAYEGQIGQIGYAASKGAVAAMTLPMARDLHRQGIRVCAIAPGMFETPMVEGLPTEVRESLGAAVPFPPRLGKPSEFARLVLEIAENPMLNGTVMRLDGAIRLAPR